MCKGALHWAILYWHKQPAKAKSIFNAVLDLLWLHTSHYTNEGINPETGRLESIYVESTSYSGLSTSALFNIAALSRAAFGEIPAAITFLADRIVAVSDWQLWTMATDGFVVPFGDSHKSQGWGKNPPVLQAMMSKHELFYPTGATSTAKERNAASEEWLAEHRSCEVRQWFASAYYQHSYNTNALNPFQYGTHFAKNWTKIVAGCGESQSAAAADANADAGVANEDNEDGAEEKMMLSAARQFGGTAEVVYPIGGYAAFRSPLLAPNASRYANAEGNLCFNSVVSFYAAFRGADCIHAWSNLANPQSLSLAANTPYSFLAVEAKANGLLHAEIDYGTLVWTAWGARLLSEHGYGTISSGTADPGRALSVDNNPAGHNTLVIRQANPDYNSAVAAAAAAAAAASGDAAVTSLPFEQTPKWGTKDEATFSQFNWAQGSIKKMEDVKIFGRGCVDADGSVVYGSSRVDGWFDAFHRYVCALPGGNYLIVDAFSVKPSRQAFKSSIFDETAGGGTAAYQALEVDSYFHTDVASRLSDDDGEEIAFDPLTQTNGMCSHVDAHVTSSGGHEAAEATGYAGNNVVRLEPKCGLGKTSDKFNHNTPRPPDGVAAVAGWARRGGRFTVDGLVTATTYNHQTTYLRRFRWQGGGSFVGPEGDVRAYILSAAAAPDSVVGLTRAAASAAGTLGDVGADGDTALDGDGDAFIEAATRVDDDGFPLTFAQPCPPSAQTTVAGCGSNGVHPEGLECVCVEVCSGGLLFWARLTGTAATEAVGADLQLSKVTLAGSCNATAATRNRLPQESNDEEEGGGTCGGICQDSRQFRQKGHRTLYPTEQ